MLVLVSMLALLVAWIGLSGTRDGASNAKPPPSGSARASRGGDELRGATRDEVGRRLATSASSETEDEAPTRLSHRGERWLLECRLVGSILPGQTDVVVRTADGEARFRVDEERTHLDITDLLERSSRASSIDVACEVRGVALGEVEVDLTSPAPWAEDAVVVRARIALTRDVATVAGRVLDANGHLVRGATVALVDTRGMQPTLKASTRTDASGGFEVAYLEGEQAVELVVVLAGHPPLARVLAGVAGGLEPDVGFLRLEPGVTIAGRVVGESLPRTVLAVPAVTSAPSLEIEGQSLFWIGGQPVPSQVAATLDPEGRFELVGLVEGAYDLQAAPPHAVPGTPPWTMQAEAPSAGVVFELVASRIRVRVVDEQNAPLEAVVEFVAEGGSFRAFTGDDGAVTVDARPSTDYAITVTCRGHLPEHRVVSSPAAGQSDYTIVLRPE